MEAALYIDGQYFWLIRKSGSKFKGTLNILRGLVEGFVKELAVQSQNIPESTLLELSKLGIKCKYFFPRDVEYKCWELLKANAQIRAEDDGYTVCQALLNLSAEG